ncbi:hypothetical protein JH06_5567 [Blastocystis sp. subtype 4]|uniref:hypothetical protein n=1 Tax=Blastocystis sp. subtype 4 TaxID=944170 RepID=UPI00071152A4|nr:hypothetical protein JH06_5567 [Blastocystis sp. subtype 4]KNB41349.1 hypothetical protein JH06_5567 [Blastocystis sp. subtype 4]|eukprot:XP_014524792.1 hypothetical protein JH06_5567 [Blastocystis sp. subtype 4]
MEAPQWTSKLIIGDNCCNEVNFTSLDLSRFVHLKSLVIGENSLNEIVNVTEARPELLNEVIIGENSLRSHSYTVNNRNTLLSIPWYVTALTVVSNSCNEVVINECTLSRYKLLRSVVIGSNCFKYVPELVIDGLNWLESITIGSSSFCFSCNGIAENQYRNFHLKNCLSLRELSIDRYSFSDYHIFELNHLPNLNRL